MANVFDPLQSGVVMLDVLAAGQASAAALAARQRERLAALLAAAKAHSPLYRQRLRGLPIDAPLQALPVARRDELMAQFDDWVTDPALRLADLRRFVVDPARIAEPYLGRYQVWESSGSGGAPGIFVQDAAAMAVYDALEAQRRSLVRPLVRWFDPFYLGERLAFVGATSGHFASYVSVQRTRRLYPWLAPRLQSFSILQPLDALLAQLDAFAPTIVATYPTAAVLLAEQADCGRLAWRPREVWTGGETLPSAARARIERSLGCAVRNSYGASEFLSIAWECDQGRLHVNADWVLLEPVDADGQPVPAGEMAHTTLLTNLVNRVQPLIRYDLGDQLSVCPDACACGSVLPSVCVLGRHDDMLQLRDRQGRPVTLLPLALTTALEDEAGVYDFQVAQVDARTLSLALPPCVDAATRARCHRVLQSFARMQGARAPRIVDRSEPLRGRSGKMKRVLAR